MSRSCTGLTSKWCPNCGDCECPDEDLDFRFCPLHGPASKHPWTVPSKWYQEHWSSKETAGFVAWFEKDYGLVSDFFDEDVEEYWIRRGFALMGWLAAKEKS